MPPGYSLRPAEVSDLDNVLGLIDSAAAWLRTKGTDQWASPWPSASARCERVLDGLRAGHTWLVTRGARPVATISFNAEADPKLWTEFEQDDPSVYVHRLVVDRGYAGRGIGAGLVDWAAQRSAQAYGAIWVRIDVWTTNTALHAYYLSQSFVPVRCRPQDHPDYPACALFQRKIDPPGAAHMTHPFSVPLEMVVSGESYRRSGRGTVDG
jgi:GNAT superfamily N-acetyltransferase